LFDPYDVDDIAHALTEAIEKDIHDPQRKNILLSRAAEFGWEKTARKTHQVYQQIASSSRRQASI
jgi:glycosyltransferase involved in cell wall biosynthesis